LTRDDTPPSRSGTANLSSKSLWPLWDLIDQYSDDESLPDFNDPNAHEFWKNYEQKKILKLAAESTTLDPPFSSSRQFDDRPTVPLATSASRRKTSPIMYANLSHLLI
jgi:hypothetical protein